MLSILVFFVFKQKTAYEVRMSDWSSDVCSSDLFAVEDGLATIEFTRPKALNALTLGMIREMHPRLDAWEDDEAVKAVLITGEGEKAFCAGGDVRAVYRSIVDDLAGKGPSELSKSFFLEEYRLNHARSEEHTSELQSLMRISYAVFCLKKKK